MDEELKITEKWDKVISKSNKVNHTKVTFKNHFETTLATDLYNQKDKIFSKGKFRII